MTDQEHAARIAAQHANLNAALAEARSLLQQAEVNLSDAIKAARAAGLTIHILSGASGTITPSKLLQHEYAARLAIVRELGVAE